MNSQTFNEDNLYKLLLDKTIIIYIIMVILLNLSMNINFADDVDYFKSALDNTNILDYIIFRYNDGPNTRVIIDSIVAVIARVPLLFKLINTFILIGLAVSIKKLIPEIKEKKFIYCISLLFIILYPFMNMSEAGWIATEINYSWPFCGFLYVLTGLKKHYENKKVYFYEYISYIICFLFLTNSEQICVVSLGTLILILFLLNKNKEKNKNLFLYILIILNIGALLFIITAPGFERRIILETPQWPEYPMYSFIDKIYMGFTETLNIIIRNYNFIFLGFCVFTSLFLFKKNKNVFLRIISLIPIMLILFLTYLKPIITQPFPMMAYVFYFADKINASNAANPVSYMPLLVYLTIMFCLIISLNYVFDDLKDFIINLVIVGLGFASRLAMSFSPTLYRSGERTALLLYASLIFSIIYMFIRYSDKLTFKEKKIIFYSLYILELLTFANTIINVLGKGSNYIR